MVTEACRLCLEAKPLLNSHVLPELLYRLTYARAGGALSFHEDIEHVRILRKGVRERLLCQDCEGVLKEHEDYFAAEWIQKARLPGNLPEVGSQVQIVGLDYRRFKLFHLSIAWRTGIATGTDYRPIDIGEHQEPLRLMLLRGDPGRCTDYPVFGCALRMRSGSRPAMGAIGLSTVQQVGPLIATSTIYAGCDWYCALGRDAVSEYNDSYLTEDGSLLLPVESIMSRESLVRILSGREASYRKAVRKLR